MKRRQFKLLPMFLVVCMLFTLAVSGCDNKTDPTKAESTVSGTPTEPAKLEVVEATFYHYGAFYNTTKYAVATDPVSKLIEEKFRIKLKYLPADDQKSALMLASNDMADLNVFQTGTQSQILKGGLAMDITSLVSEFGKDITANHLAAVDATKQNQSDGTNKLFFFPSLCAAKETFKVAFPTVSTYVRWDYYKELGYPEIKSYDDLFNVLKQMQDKHPKTEDGKKVYGLSCWNDWGAYWPLVFPFLTYEGGMNHTDGFYIFADGTIKNNYSDPNSGGWKNIELLNKANRMGILDPEYLTTKWDGYQNKVNNGQILCLIGRWWSDPANQQFIKNGQPDKGYGQILIPGKYVEYSSRESTLLGWPDLMFVGNNSKIADRLVKMFNYFSTYEGSRIIHSGIEGVNWDMVNGKPVMKADSLNLIKTNPDYKYETGIGLYTNIAGYAARVSDPKNGITLAVFEDPIYQIYTDIDKDYLAHNGGTTPVEVVKKMLDAGTVKDSYWDYSVSRFIPTVPDDLHKINLKAEQYFTQEAPKCVYAASDAEFTSIKNKIIEEINSYGYLESYKWMSTEWDAGRKKLDALKASMK